MTCALRKETWFCILTAYETSQNNKLRPAALSETFMVHTSLVQSRIMPLLLDEVKQTDNLLQFGGIMHAYTSANQDQLTELRQQVVDTLLEIDNINLQLNPRILANYAKAIGYLETGLYKWQLRARRAKRKFSLAQSAANKGETILLNNIEKDLDSEFDEWETKLSTLLAEQLRLLETLAGSRLLSPTATRELKTLHKKLIKRLHPDLQPNLSEEAQRFFLLAQSAYENGDLAMLRAIDTATEDYENAKAPSEQTEDNLEIEIAMTEAQLNIAVEKLNALKSSRPYILSDLLDDPVKLAKRKKELEDDIERQKEVCVCYEEKIADLMDEGKRRALPPNIPRKSQLSLKDNLLGL